MGFVCFKAEHTAAMLTSSINNMEIGQNFRNGNGYKWLPRCQKPKYSKEDRAARLQFAEEVLQYTPQGLQKEVTMCMDGVVLTLPPNDAVERENYVKVGYTHVWRKPGEAAKPELLGGVLSQAGAVRTSVSHVGRHRQSWLRIGNVSSVAQGGHDRMG